MVGHDASVKADNRSLVLFDRGDDVVVKADVHGVRLLQVSRAKNR
jgi:hypothetical protein